MFENSKPRLRFQIRFLFRDEFLIYLFFEMKNHISFYFKFLLSVIFLPLPFLSRQSSKGDRCGGAGLPPSAFLPSFPLSPFILHLFTPSFAGVPSSRGSSRRSNFCRLSSHFGWGLRHELQND